LNEASVEQSNNARKLTQLQQQAKDLQDPAYIERLARQRLQYAMPGDTVYVVTHEGDKPDLATSNSQSGDAVKEPGQTWNQRLWGTVRTADATP